MDCTFDSVERGIRERAATIVGSRGGIPLALWTPEDGEPAGLVLVGHGASGHKRQDYVVTLARRLVRRHHVAVAAIDGPVHGARRTAVSEDPSLILLEFAQAWSMDASLTDAMIGDWTCALDALQGLAGLAGVPVGYWGISMGTLLGLPFVAADSRIGACVFGLAGLTGPTASRLADDAPRVTAPTLFLLQWNDELFTTEGSLALFSLLGSTEKRLYAAPGRHKDVPADAFQLSIDFLASNLDFADRAAEPAR